MGKNLQNNNSKDNVNLAYKNMCMSEKLCMCTCAVTVMHNN